MLKEKDVKKLLKKALEDIITTEAAIVTFLRNEYGDEAVQKFYTDYRPQFLLELQLGMIRRALAKMAAKIAKKTLLKMIIDTLIEKGGWYQPEETIEIVRLDKKGSDVRILPCTRRKMFKKIMKKKNKSIEPTYMCHTMCIPELNHYLTFIGLSPTITVEDNGCLVSAVWDPDKIQFEEDLEDK
ncbi:MAG: hypothetical protein HWN65_03480 [Candidatus Helarchaeota archaeon]|nr:hypothetical protein [Candidatus Helarchaeota archaeon]